jgi:hypothetical protein
MFCRCVRLTDITEYLYTGDLPCTDDQDILLHMLGLAHLWQISMLMEATQVRLVKYITMDTYDTCKSFWNRLYVLVS